MSSPVSPYFSSTLTDRFVSLLAELRPDLTILQSHGRLLVAGTKHYGYNVYDDTNITHAAAVDELAEFAATEYFGRNTIRCFVCVVPCRAEKSYTAILVDIVPVEVAHE
jgi:hypothetical protein